MKYFYLYVLCFFALGGVIHLIIQIVNEIKYKIALYKNRTKPMSKYIPPPKPAMKTKPVEPVESSGIDFDSIPIPQNADFKDWQKYVKLHAPDEQYLEFSQWYKLKFKHQ